MLLVNVYPPIMEDGGLLYYFYLLDEWTILPSLIFLGVGALTDFGPLIANPKSFLLGAAAQFGIFGAYIIAMLIGFNDMAAAAIAIIGGADGPTSIYLAMKLHQTDIMGAYRRSGLLLYVAGTDYSAPYYESADYEGRAADKMEQLRPVSREKEFFPIIVTIIVCGLLPSTTPLVGMLMLGNLFRESGVVRQLTETASNALMYIVVILLGTSVGATTSADAFLNWSTIKIVILGLAAFCFWYSRRRFVRKKLMCKLSGGKINPLIGSAGVSAVPMAARVSQKVGAEADPTNFLLMHAMGPNVAGVIGTAVAAGVFMAIFGV